MGSIQCQCNKNNEKEFVIEKKIEEGNPSAIASSSSQFPNVQSTGECNNNKEELNKNEEKDKEEDLNDKEHAHLDSNNPDSSWEYESNSNTKHNNRYNIFNIPQRQTKNQVGMSTNPPLEIINEMAGPSKDSFANEEGEMKNERDIVIVDEDETEQPNAKPSTIRSRNLQPSDDGRISSNVLQNMEDNHISFQKGNKKSVIEPIRKSQLIIKNKINWKSLLINHIIPEGKLIKTQDDDILFQSDLLKYLKDHKQARGGKILSPKFCLLTRTEFKIYRSKEAVLHMQPPITSVSLFNIVEVNQLELGNKMDKDYFSFYIDHVIPGTKTTHARPVSPKFNTSLSNIEANSKNKSAIVYESFDHKKERENSLVTRKSKRMSLIDKVDSKDKSNISKILCDKNEVSPNERLVFFSQSAELVAKWICVLNYFISK